MIALVLLVAFAAFCLLWPVFASDRPAPVLPLSPDDEALRDHYRAVERRKVDALRLQSEAIRRHYEGITWPAICWEVRRREMARHMPSLWSAS